MPGENDGRASGNEWVIDSEGGNARSGAAGKTGTISGKLDEGTSVGGIGGVVFPSGVTDSHAGAGPAGVGGKELVDFAEGVFEFGIEGEIVDRFGLVSVGDQE